MAEKLLVAVLSLRLAPGAAPQLIDKPPLYEAEVVQSIYSGDKHSIISVKGTIEDVFGLPHWQEDMRSYAIPGLPEFIFNVPKEIFEDEIPVYVAQPKTDDADAPYRFYPAAWFERVPNN